jgi:S1-C subfamily serine protease/predicted Fe-Mo cluster-binding NifX family protein
LINNPSFPAGIGSGQIQLINQNKAVPYLGLILGETTKAVAKELNIPANTGVYVTKVISMSPAEKAGLMAGDVLLSCDHKPVNSHEEVGQVILNKKAGDVIKLVLNRRGRKKSFHAKLESAPPSGLIPAAAQDRSKTWMGADIQDIDAVMNHQFNLPDNKGVIVTHVAGKSPAHTAGIQTGDVIRRFGVTDIKDVKQMQSLILKGQPDSRVQLTVFRNGHYLTLPVVLGQRVAAAGRTPLIVPAEMTIEGSWIGMDVDELSARDATEMGLPAGTRGILVEDVESPPATMVGFQTGDVITAINGVSTPDMKQFVEVTENLPGAVVDVIRGRGHIFISVPPPGYTQQGTKLKTALDNKFKRVALTRPVYDRFAIVSSGPDLNAYVAENTIAAPYLILVDLSNNSFAYLGPDSVIALPDTIQRYTIPALICSDISPDTASALAAKEVAIYSGVVGTAMDAIGLYKSNSLIAMKDTSPANFVLAAGAG